MPDQSQKSQSGSRTRRTARVRYLASSLGALLWIYAALAFSNEPAQGIAVTDDRGINIQLDATPMRIVSLLPSLTETVCVLGACDRLVGTDRFSDWPEQIEALPKLGGFEDVQVERLYALRPDIVLAAQSTRVIDRLESLGLTVLAVEPRSLADVRRVVGLLGKVLDLPEAASSLLASIDVKQQKAASLVPAHWHNARVYFEVSETLYAAGEASFIGELLQGLGLANIVPATLGPFPKLNPEFIVRANPDIILASQRNIESMSSRPGWDELSALENSHTCAFEEQQYDVLVRPGPRLGEAATILAQCIAALPHDKSQ